MKNEFLSRRELVCDFDGGAGILKKLDAVDAVTKEHSLEGKLVIPIRLQNHVGKTHTTATFFVYEDETLAKKHITASVLARIEKLKEAAKAESEKPAEVAEDAPAAEPPKDEASASKDDAPAKSPKDQAPKEEASASKDDAPAEPPKDEAVAQPEVKAEESKPKEGAE